MDNETVFQESGAHIIHYRAMLYPRVLHSRDSDVGGHWFFLHDSVYGALHGVSFRDTGHHNVYFQINGDGHRFLDNLA